MAVKASAPASITLSERATIFSSRTRSSMTCRSVAASDSVLVRSSSAFSPVGASRKAASSALIPADAFLTASVLAIGVHAVPPFVMQDRDGSWYGLGVDLMNALSRNLNTDHRFVETDPADMVARVADGTLGAAIGPVPINARDEAVIDFSVPYYSGDLGVALRVVDKIGPTMMFELLTSPAFLYMLGLLTGPVFVIGALIWLLGDEESSGHRVALGVLMKLMGTDKRRKQLDRALTVRFAGLSSNAMLELVEGREHLPQRGAIRAVRHQRQMEDGGRRLTLLWHRAP